MPRTRTAGAGCQWRAREEAVREAAWGQRTPAPSSARACPGEHYSDWLGVGRRAATSLVDRLPLVKPRVRTVTSELGSMCTFNTRARHPSPDALTRAW